jgi:hypothetical protein
MQISSISAAIQSYVLSFEKSFDQKSKSSPTSYATTQAAAPTNQQSTTAASETPQAATAPDQAVATANANRYLSSVSGIAALLSSQGATITDPNLVQFINPRDVMPGSAAATGTVSGTPATPAYVASQIIEGVGSNGVLTLAEVENAENGTKGAPTSNSNSDTDIAADFDKMSGGASTMTAAQLAGAIQSYMDSQH